MRPSTRKALNEYRDACERLVDGRVFLDDSDQLALIVKGLCDVVYDVAEPREPCDEAEHDWWYSEEHDVRRCWDCRREEVCEEGAWSVG